MKKLLFMSFMFFVMLLKGYAQPSYPPNSPTRNAADVISLFSDTYTNVSGTDWFPNWGQATVVSDVTIYGNTIKKYEIGRAHV